ncbi:MFS transporter [Mycobacterium sp. NPDC051804]|uniref:MFS transporter n=1 Tax=Mycobacterium sp. NPDC051804 TaxID=3364295 RepID=UPI0037AC40B3
MAARNEGERAPRPPTTERAERATSIHVEQTTPDQTGKLFRGWRPVRQYTAAVIAIGGVQLMAMMHGPVAIFALPSIQDELGLSDAGRSWVITANLLTFGGLMLLGGRVGDTIGRKRAFIIGVALFTVASAMSALAWNIGTLIVAQLLKGAAAAIMAPTCVALVATTFPKGPIRNAAMALLGAMAGFGGVVGLAAGGALTQVSWRLAFAVTVPIGLLVLFLARTTLKETDKELMKLDVAGAVLATVTCGAAVFGFSMGAESGWLSVTTIGSAVVAVIGAAAFAVVERTAENPIMPFSIFFDRDRLATFATLFLAGGVMFTLVLLVTVYVQNLMGYSPLRAAIAFIPFAIAVAMGMGVSSRLVAWLPPRVVVVLGTFLMLGALLYGSTLNRDVHYFPNLVLPIVLGGIAIGVMNVPLGLSLIASVGIDRLGPTSAIAVMLQSLGGPLVLAVIQAVITSRTVHLGGASGPVKLMNAAQLDALDHGYTYGLLWLAGVVIVLGVVALLIRYTAADVAHAQESQKALDAA